MAVLFIFLIFLGCLLGFVGLTFGARAIRWTLIALFASPFVLTAIAWRQPANQPANQPAAVATPTDYRQLMGDAGLWYPQSHKICDPYSDQTAGCYKTP
jgi:hypothetical protein